MIMAEEMVKLLLEVPAEHAQEILKYRNPELVTRGVFKRFKNFFKCKVSEAPPDAAEAMEKAMNAFAKKTSTSIESVRKTVSNIEKNSQALTDSVKNISVNVDKLTNITKITQGLSFLNAGMPMANLAVNIAGFAMVSKQLSELSDKIKEIDVAIQKQVEEKKIDKVIDGRELIMAYNDMADAWKNDQKISLDKEQELLRQMTSYVSSITEYMERELLDIELCMDIIMNLLPAYTITISEYIKHYYFDNNNLPTNLDLYKAVYREFLKPEVKNLLLDYFFLGIGVGYNEAVDDTNMIVLLALNDLTTIEDQEELLKMTETEEEYKEVDRELAKIAQMQLDEVLSAAS